MFLAIKVQWLDIYLRCFIKINNNKQEIIKESTILWYFKALIRVYYFIIFINDLGPFNNIYQLRIYYRRENEKLEIKYRTKKSPY